MSGSGRLTPALTAQPTDPFDGLLLVDKPLGMTSHDVVARVRRTFGFKKVGHGGTLDPDAGGLLILLLGRGTRLSQAVMSGDKVYEGTACLGISTDSQDAQGRVVETRDASQVTREALQAAIQTMIGDQYQTPPMVSAVKIKGVPLYKLARKGQTVERKPRLVHVYRFDLTGWNPPQADFRVKTGKGVYVRTLCHDIGETLGCGAHLCALRRVQSGALALDQALALDDLLRLDRTRLQAHIIPYFQYLRQSAPGALTDP